MQSIITWPTYVNSGVLDTLVDKLYQNINSALDKTCPMAPASKILQSNPWFTQALKVKRKEVFALLDKYRASKTTEALDRYKQKLKSYKKHCDKARKKYRATYKEKLGSTKDMAAYVESLSRQRTPQIGTIKRADGSYTLPGVETLQALADIHFTGHNNSIVRDLECKTFQTSEVMSQGLDWILKVKNLRGLKPIIFKHLPQNLLDIIQLIYKGMICTGYTPEAWTHARVVFIPKPGKPDYTNPKAFRPISHTNYLVKGMEKLVR